MSKGLRQLGWIPSFFVLVSLVEAQPSPDSLELTLNRAIDMALEDNLDVEVSRLNTQVQGEGIASAQGAYKPMLSANFNTMDSRNPSNNQLVGAATLIRSTTNYNFGWQQSFGIGLNYSLSFSNQRVATNSAFSSFNPLYDTSINAQVTQPLLRNLNLNANEQRLVTARNGERISQQQFEARVMDVVRDVENAYWDLAASIRGLDVANQSLTLARDLLRNNRVQVEVGTMAPLDVLEAEAEVASREEAVIVAQAAIEQSEDVLKRLINDPDAEDFWELRIRPVDRPADTDVQIDVKEAIRVALERRPELAQSRTGLDTQNYNLRYTRNQLRPQVDLVGSLAFSGLGGTRTVRGGLAGEVIEEIPGGYSDALNELFGGDYRDWSVGLSVSYPVGRSTQDAAHAQAQVEYRRQRTALQSQELVIAQEVRTAARAVETNRKRVEATRVARELAERRLKAEQRKFDLGMSTSFLVVQAQRDATEAAANELRAVLDHTKALVAFERAKGTLLDRENIRVR